MIPIKDQIPTRRVPFINYLLLLANIFVFIIQWLAGPNQEALIYQFALIPASFTSGIGLGDITDIFSSMFMHALIGGLVASLAHIFTNPGSQIPTVGASGAIAAVLGAYLVLYPNARVLTIIPLGFFLRLTMIPAVIVLGLWFVLQLFSGVLSMGGPDVGGVAFWAHIGGFVAGVILAKVFAKKRHKDTYVRW